MSNCSVCETPINTASAPQFGVITSCKCGTFHITNMMMARGGDAYLIHNKLAEEKEQEHRRKAHEIKYAYKNKNEVRKRLLPHARIIGNKIRIRKKRIHRRTTSSNV